MPPAGRDGTMNEPQVNVVCEGTPREMGRAQGAGLREPIAGVRDVLAEMEAFRLQQPRWLPYGLFRWVAWGGLAWVLSVAGKLLLGYLLQPPVLGGLERALPHGAYIAMGAAYLGLLTGVTEVLIGYGIARRLGYRSCEQGRGYGLGFGALEAALMGLLLLSAALTVASTPDALPLERLPLAGSHALDLSAWQLEKTDRLKVQLFLLDYRGELPGADFVSDPLYLEISDESGVLGAILEADERSEERLTEIIKRQLGIGESP